jgi:NADPH2:quinone reductase
MTTTTSPTIRIDKAGGPEEMKLVDLPVGAPGAGEVRIRHHASGLNYIDVYQRSGVYTLPMPLTMGNEGAGVIEAVGAGVTHLKEGDRVAYCSGPPGSYSLARVMPAKTVVRLPDAISFETGAAMMLKGLTVQYAPARVRAQEAVEPGDSHPLPLRGGSA